jgi:hypothetical protein
MRTILRALTTGKYILLAVVAALTLATASVAVAGSGVGGVFNLGQTNTVNAITKLVGSVTGASLVVDNNSTGTGATALDLQVEPGKTPMKVNSTTKVANLNADRLDGKDSTQFANGVGGKATDADKLDGKDSTAFGRLAFTKAEAFNSILEGEGLKDLASVTITIPGNQSQLVEVTGNFMVWDFDNPQCPCEVDYYLREQGAIISDFEDVGFVIVGPTGESGGPGTSTTVFTAAPGTHTYVLSVRSFFNTSDALNVNYARMTAKTIPFDGTGATPTSTTTTTTAKQSVTGRASDR